MGGRIAIGIIEQNGTLKTVEAHTKFMPGAIVNEAFSKTGDVGELREFLANYEHDTFGEGFGRTGNTPSDYGYVLIDLREGNFVSAQKFTTFSHVIGAEIANADFFKRGGKAGADGLARMITHRHDWNEEEQRMVAVEVGPFEDARALIANPELLYYEPNGVSRSFSVSFPAWKTIFHDCNAEGLEELRDYLADRNLLTDNDLGAWEEAIEEHRRLQLEMEEFNETRRTSSPKMG